MTDISPSVATRDADKECLNLRLSTVASWLIRNLGYENVGCFSGSWRAMISPVAGVRDKPHNLSIAQPQFRLHRHTRVPSFPVCGAPWKRVGYCFHSKSDAGDSYTALTIVYNSSTVIKCWMYSWADPVIFLGTVLHGLVLNRESHLNDYSQGSECLLYTRWQARISDSMRRDRQWLRMCTRMLWWNYRLPLHISEDEVYEQCTTWNT